MLSRPTFLGCSRFFIKQILEALSNPSQEKTSKAYVYAILAFLCSLTKFVVFSSRSSPRFFFAPSLMSPHLYSASFPELNSISTISGAAEERPSSSNRPSPPPSTTRRFVAETRLAFRTRREGLLEQERWST